MAGFENTPFTGVVQEPYKARQDRWLANERGLDIRPQSSYKPKGKKSKTDSENALEILAQQYYANAMQGASAIGQQMGQSLNRRGLGGSPLGAGLQSQAMNQALGRAQSEVAKMRLGYMTQQEAFKRQEQMQSDQMLYQYLSLILSVGGRVAEKKGLFDDILGQGTVDLDYDYESGKQLGNLAGLDPVSEVSDPNVFGRSPATRSLPGVRVPSAIDQLNEAFRR